MIKKGWAEAPLTVFPHPTLAKFLRTISDGQIPLSLARIEASQKSAEGVT